MRSGGDRVVQKKIGFEAMKGSKFSGLGDVKEFNFNVFFGRVRMGVGGISLR